MEIKDLADRVDERLNRIEEKLDMHIQGSITNAADIHWIKGYIRLSTSVILTILGAVFTYFTGLFKS